MALVKPTMLHAAELCEVVIALHSNEVGQDVCARPIEQMPIVAPEQIPALAACLWIHQ